MKKFLTYEQMRTSLLEVIPTLAEYKPTHIVGVVRGGVTIAHIVAKELRLPLGFWFPAKDVLTLPDYDGVNPANLIVCEDLIAQGRTLTQYQNSASLQDFNRRFFSYLVDEKYTGVMPDYHVTKTSEWLVFPWESYNKVVEGDRGLFRERTDQYGKNTDRVDESI